MSLSSRWWYSQSARLIDLTPEDRPIYVYHKETVDERATSLQQTLTSIDQFYYATKANNNENLLARLVELGFGLECVSIGELRHASAIVASHGLTMKTPFLFTPNFAGKREYEDAFKMNVYVTIDNIYPLKQWTDVFAGKSVFLRLDPEHGDGHHDHVKTAGSRSKFGISVDQMDELLSIVTEANIKVIGLHSHCGSGIFEPSTWARNGRFLAQFRDRFPHLKFIDVGGGLGIPEQPLTSPLALHEVERHLQGLKKECPDISFLMEPGRFLIAESGVLLCRVTQLKTKREVYYVGVNGGMHTLIRPALYGSKHFIYNLSKPLDPSVALADVEALESDIRVKKCNIVGPICESGDFLGRDRFLPANTSEGDVILIDTAGAYGQVMSSNYNLREPAIELWLMDETN